MFIKRKYKYKSELHLSLEYLQNNWQRRGLGKMFLSANFQDGDCYFGKKRMIRHDKTNRSNFFKFEKTYP